jgi:hypothetical protein
MQSTTGEPVFGGKQFGSPNRIRTSNLSVNTKIKKWAFWMDFFGMRPPIGTRGPAGWRPSSGQNADTGASRPAVRLLWEHGTTVAGGSRAVGVQAPLR